MCTFISVFGGSFEATNNNYVGVGPFSEPETRSVSRYIESISSNLVGVLSFRSFGQKLLIPLAHTSADEGSTMYNYDEMVSFSQCSSDTPSLLPRPIKNDYNSSQNSSFLDSQIR